MITRESKLFATFNADGDPTPQSRPRRVKAKNSDKMMTFSNSKKVAAWKEEVGWQCKRARPVRPFSGAISVSMDFFLKRPKTHKADPKPVTGADADNLAKAVMDVLTDQEFWTDDAQVTELIVRKHYADNRLPGVNVFVKCV
jgi:Holliday junction resolvase RusA-like endonuclease